MQLGARTTGGLVTVVVASGGTGYTAPPSVSVGGGTGAVLYSQLAGTAVGNVVVQVAGTGFSASSSVSFSGGGGTGAAGTAYGYTGTLKPISLFKGRYNDLYGVDGMGRGVRWDGSSTGVTPIGLAAPVSMPAVTASLTSSSGGVWAIQILDGGNGYYSPPTVGFTGGTPSRGAVARASLVGGRVTKIDVIDSGAGYATTPSVALTGGIGSGASFTVGVLGEVAGIAVVNPGSGFATTAVPTATFGNTNGLTNAYVRFSVNQSGQIDPAEVMSAGTGATAAGVTASVTGGGGTGTSLRVRMNYSVTAVTVGNSGSGYFAAPLITFRPATSDPEGFGAAATASVNSAGQITGVTVYAGGSYREPPTAVIENTQAIAQVETRKPFRGVYKCCFRYIDSAPPSQGGPRASSISPLKEIDAGDGKDSLQWSVTHGTVDGRVTAMELWRTTSDQSVLLFRVATILTTDGAWSGSYTDLLSDDELKDPDRAGYALMPVTLPSGQINARRFDPPPGEFAVGVMFQDRAWYAVDTTGLRPNSLMFSEVDEPESVPSANELVVQENTGEPDKVVALIPLGAYLIVAQQAHLYRLAYVAQPVIDASIVLAGYRGILNNRCWTVMGGVAFIADSVGIYAFDGNGEEAISVAIDNFWRDNVIDFSKADKFHVQADHAARVVRFFYCQSADAEPTRALCYSIATKAWWEEQFATAVTAGCASVSGGRRLSLSGGADGEWRAESLSSSESVSYAVRTGPMQLVNEGGSRSLALVYTPTASDSTLSLRLHYNNSTSPRANAVASDIGNGFTTQTGSTAAQLNMKKTRSALGDSTGYAVARLSGRVTPESAGGDRHVAMALAGTQSAGDPVVIHSVQIEGAT
jgi:hypothetical protein